MKAPQISQRAATMGIVIVLSSMVLFVACSPAKWKNNPPAPQVVPARLTGDPLSEHQQSPSHVASPQPGQNLIVVPDHLCGRTTADQDCQSTDPVVEKGDQVEVVDPTPQGPDQTLKVRITQTAQPSAPVEPIYLPLQYLTAESPETSSPVVAAQDRFFVVQNIATEKLRVYENCALSSSDKFCKHRLVLQTDLVVGEDLPGKRTRLGSYRITEWHKFYQDHEDSYPAWYHKDYPQLPAPGADLSAWESASLLPHGNGSVRGAFGWYTAFLGPNADEQWLHGSWGWGQDGGTFIKALFQAPASEDAKLASHGCTRIENQAIAFMRQILVPGTKLIRVYAREAYNDSPSAAVRSRSWSWILTSEDSGAPTADRAEVEKRGADAKKLEGPSSFKIDTTPMAAPLISNSQNKHQNGNVYNIAAANFKGYFLVDSGRLVGYTHPQNLLLGGMEPRTQLPAIALGPANTPIKLPRVQ